MSERLFTVSATLNGSVQDKEVFVESFTIEYHNELLNDDWTNEQGHLSRKGVKAMMLGYASGLVSVIHSAEQHSEMDSAALLREAVELLENQFVLVVKSTPVLIEKPARDGTEPEEIP